MIRHRKLIYTAIGVLVVLFGLSFWASTIDDGSRTPLTVLLGSLFSITTLLLGGYAYYVFVYAPQKKQVKETVNQEDETGFDDKQDLETQTLDEVDDDYEPEYPTQEIPTIHSEDATESEDTTEAATPARSRVMSGNDLRRSLLKVKRLLVWMVAIWLLATFVAIIEYMSPTSHLGLYIIVGIAVVAVLILGDAPIRMLLRDRHKDTSDDDMDEETLYKECPHFTLILKVVIVQIAFWTLTSAASVFVYTHTSVPLWVNLYMQWLITILNVYFITRKYIAWRGTIYTWTKSYFRIETPQDIFFAIFVKRSDPRAAKTLVGLSVIKNGWDRPPFFARRGKVIIDTQKKTEPQIIVTHVFDPNRFEKAYYKAVSAS